MFIIVKSVIDKGNTDGIKYKKLKYNVGLATEKFWNTVDRN